MSGGVAASWLSCIILVFQYSIVAHGDDKAPSLEPLVHDSRFQECLWEDKFVSVFRSDQREDALRLLSISGEDALDGWTKPPDIDGVTNFTLSDAGLVISRSANTSEIKPHALISASVFTSSSGGYGRVSVRAKLPKSPRGSPLIRVTHCKDDKDVLCPQYVSLGSFSTSKSEECQGCFAVELHTEESSARRSNIQLPCTETSDGFHVFTLEKEEQLVRWYIDDFLVNEVHRWDNKNSSFQELIDADFRVVIGFVNAPEPSLAAAQSNAKSEDIDNPEIVIDYVRVAQRVDMTGGCPYNWSVATAPVHCQSTPEAFNAYTWTISDGFKGGSFHGFVSKNEAYDRLSDFKTKYSEFATSHVIGYSTAKGQPINALCVGATCAHSGYKSPQVLYNGQHHSREPVSTMVVLHFLDLLAGALDRLNIEFVSLLFQRELWFLPLVNPDGYEWNQDNLKFGNPVTMAGHRKNGKKTCSKDEDSGVDLNRNYDICWNLDNIGSNDSPCAEDYRGPAPFSENETQSMRSFILGNNFSIALNYHGYGRVWTMPYGCKHVEETMPKRDRKIFDSFGAALTAENKYPYGPSWTLPDLYPVNGEASDWMFSAAHVFAFSPEVGPAFEGDDLAFWPLSAKLPGLVQELVYSNTVAAKVSGLWLEINAISQDAKEEMPTSLKIQVQNRGLRGPIDNLSIRIARSPYHLLWNESSKSFPGALDEAEIQSSSLSETGAMETITIALSQTQNAGTLYASITDGSSCFLYRIGLRPKSKVHWSKASAISVCTRCAPLPATQVDPFIAAKCHIMPSLSFIDFSANSTRTDSETANRKPTPAESSATGSAYSRMYWFLFGATLAIVLALFGVMKWRSYRIRKLAYHHLGAAAAKTQAASFPSPQVQGAQSEDRPLTLHSRANGGNKNQQGRHTDKDDGDLALAENREEDMNEMVVLQVSDNDNSSQEGENEALKS